MTHSKVFYDSAAALYTVLVSHPRDAELEEWLTMEYGMFRIYGLIEYSFDTTDGTFRVFDVDEGKMYTVGKDWAGVDKDAAKALLSAAQSELSTGFDAEFERIKAIYEKTGDPEQALHVHPVGTVVRVDYGDDDLSEPDVLVKRATDRWEMAGITYTLTDVEIEQEDYEVIYYV